MYNYIHVRIAINISYWFQEYNKSYIAVIKITNNPFQTLLNFINMYFITNKNLKEYKTIITKEISLLFIIITPRVNNIQSITS